MDILSEKDPTPSVDRLTPLGDFATVLGIASNIPQLISVATTANPGESSIYTWLLSLASNIVWTWYGFKISALPLIISSIFSLLVSVYFIVAIISYSKLRKKASRDK